MKIALDAMGGDFAPDANIEGVKLILEELPANHQLVLIGKKKVIEEQLSKQSINSSAVEIVHAEEVIGMDEHPTKAFTQKQHSSIGVGFQLLAKGEVQAFCSAGNTGAMHVGAMFSVKPCEGIIRPALASAAPRESGKLGLLLDVGANADCKPDMLLQFGELGALYAKYVYGIDEPKVALINLGEEEKKGTVVTQAAYQLFKQDPRIDFVGNIEGRDIFSEKSDVMVCNGFTGNVILKMAESVYHLLEKRGFTDPFFDQMNYEAIGGSPILGVNGNVVIGHGVSSGLAIKNMLLQSLKMAETNLHLKIRDAFGK
ncbi:glycerol-3-phosphate acyltransferase PlsX [Catalinimonas alkaloidigena]|uniref:phosphate acyltransferase PlsX n=1 Tax=Catalinimonas alkaloidigena TaxID=1075417 RepID=UPI002406542E|nr:phosphate acyltransferase PlsX [Catalinimonas alkaloidigena]MDF9800311.1 glycerol-3-phosphate acyltransferase PlsX [Catalinimonas alkaloidigena]